MSLSDIIGWLSSAVLLGTIAKQVHKQWASESSEGLSIWLFIGQMLASFGFLVYSWMVNNMVFVFTNALMVVNGLIGFYVYKRNSRRTAAKG